LRPLRTQGGRARRHFGRVLIAYRRAQPSELTQAQLGRWLGLTQGQVSRIERGVTPVNDLAKLDRWSRALHLPQEHWWFPPQASSTYAPKESGRKLPASTNATEGEDDVQRRRFLKSASVGAIALGSSLLQSSGSLGQTDYLTTEHPDVVTVKEMTQTFRRLDNRYGGGRNRSALVTFLNTTVPRMLNDVSAIGDARKELYGAAAEMHQLAGWMAYDVGQAKPGRSHLREALRLCQDIGDEALAGEMLAGMSHHAAFHREPAHAVDLALAARVAAKRAGLPKLQAEAAVMEAHGLALQGDKQACLNILREAEEAFAKSSGTESPTWLDYFDEAYLAAKFAHAFRDLGIPKEAERFARRSLEMSDGYERGRLFNTALLASTLADQGLVQEATSLASDALDMTSTVRSVRSSAYIADVGRRLKPFSGARDVRTLYARMAAAGITISTR
jgi:transcriptional regulator with XRE-family HTH domain